MTDYTISCKLSNETVYACYRGRFWRWDGSIWKESHLMTQKFERAKAADKKLTPQEFLSNGAEFAPLDEYEIDCAMLDALENAKPCKNAPIEPMEEHPTPSAQCLDAATAAESQTAASPAAPEGSSPTTETADAVSGSDAPGNATGKNAVPSAGSGSSLSNPAAPTFDFSALGELSEQAVETDQQFDLHYGTAQDEYLISCIYVAKMHALTAKAGRYGGGTWTKWYESKGMSKSSVWNMLQTGEGFKGSTAEQLTSIPELSRKDLNLIARSGCAEQLTAAAGDSQRVQELLAQLKAKEYKLNETQARLKSACIQEQESRDAMNTANAQLEAANADIKGLTEQNDQLRSRLDSAEAREEEAWKMQSKAEARAKNAEDALKKQPIVGVTDPEEVRRQADALAADAKAQAQRQIEDAQRRAREAEARYQKLQQDADGFLAPEQSCAQQAKIIADSMRSMYLGWFGLASTTGTPLARMAAPIYQVCDEIRESLEEDTTINPTAEGSVEDAEREALFE
nr:MAG TPA: chromosome segregation protein [Caudoviricetes sp.]